ncbi:hypothetical protein GCM10007231_07950 [Nocardioides daphniae]|uniref:Uncharacterized protein n=1 Tax=Nocardioides daphniae TaxID=402297 RepID=A0ABQ1Q2X6_9ACTN|nr:hypothetical protein GCM10007231_07950 [Nocardioides daphniae]
MKENQWTGRLQVQPARSSFPVCWVGGQLYPGVCPRRGSRRVSRETSVALVAPRGVGAGATPVLPPRGPSGRAALIEHNEDEDRGPVPVQEVQEFGGKVSV